MIGGLKKAGVIALLWAMTLPAPSRAEVRGWQMYGGDVTAFSMERDGEVTHQGAPSVRVQSVRKPTGFGCMAQGIQAKDYRGKRIRFAGYLRTQDVHMWSALWMRVDGASGEVLAFDNMRGRNLSGTNDWRRAEIVLDVPRAASKIYFGVLLVNEGTVWVSELEFVEVPTTVPVTDLTTQRQSPNAPRNLGFDR